MIKIVNELAEVVKDNEKMIYKLASSFSTSSVDDLFQVGVIGLINAYNNYSEEQIEMLADKLDNSTGQNYFSTLYQLLGDKFLAFMDVFQEDKFIIPSTVLVKHLLTNISIYKDYQDGMSIEELNNKYNRSQESLKKIIASQEAI